MKAVLFDFGGTLDTDGVHWSETYGALYERFGLRIARKELDRAFVWSEERLLADAELPASTFRRTIDKQLALQFEWLKLDGQSGVREQMLDACYRDVTAAAAKAGRLLGETRARYKFGVVSNFYGNLAVVCEELGLAKYLDATIDSAVVGVRKPDPEIYRIAVGRLGVAPGETLMVGDSYERDIIPAKEIGCRTAWLKGRSWNLPASTGAADFTIGALDELRPILL